MALFTSSFSQYSIDIPTGAHGQVYTICPKCSDDRKKKRVKCLSVNVEEGIWNCHHCSWFGGLKKSTKTYKLPPPMPAQLKVIPEHQKFFNGRGISDYTIQRFKVFSAQHYFVKSGENRRCIAFPYLRNDERINTKYRDDEKDFMMDGGAELVFFNLDSLQGAETAVITEGEIDAMALWEAANQLKPGVGWTEGVVSVPNGAVKKKDPNDSMKLEYVDNCWQSFEDIKTIIIATDGDAPGIDLRDELARRFGKAKCMYVTYPDGCKDLNDILKAHGAQDVLDCIMGAVPFPIDNVHTLSDVEKEFDHLFQYGVDRGVDTGFRVLDEHILHRKGELVVNTGIPGSGKSKFEDQLSSRLAAKHGWRTAFCSFEKQPVTLHMAGLAGCFTGKKFFSPKIDRNIGVPHGPEFMNVAEKDAAKQFIQEHFFFYNFREVKPSIDYIVEKGVELVLTQGIDKLVIDPWNYLASSKPSNMTEAEYILDSLIKLILFAKNYNVQVVIVAHPTKIQKNLETKKYDVPTLYSISGTAHWFNAVDDGYTVYRDFEDNLVTLIIQKIRWEFVGKLGKINFIYHPSGMYAEEGTDFIPDIKFYHRRLGIAL